ncbi:MAG: lipoyl(octanoyl) transferase LipB [Chloroflexi bacterium]|nr:lipoyl(octanoyl) transferase LipB [Chloroflexota bacterium]
MSATNTCLVVSFGVMDYLAAYRLQRRVHALVAALEIPDVLLLLEHPHVYTHGRRGQQSHILAPDDALARLGVETHFTDRGGETTYHGPGQLVGYPIVNLRRIGMGVRQYVHTLEQTLVGALAEYGIAAHSDGKPTGVWVDDRKIAAIGVRVSRSVTMHGFALNVSPDLSFFDHIVPCGMPDACVTSMARELVGQEGSHSITVPEALPVVAGAFGSEFGLRVECVDRSTIERALGCGVSSLF